MLKDYVADGFVDEAVTPQQLSATVKHELSQVESIITPSTHDTEQHNKAEQTRTTDEICGQNLQLELELT